MHLARSLGLALTLALSQLSCADDSSSNGRGCGNDAPTAEPVLAQTSSALSTPGVIRVYFHVIYQGTSLDDGNVSDSMINNQIAVMNQAFLPGGWSVQHVSTDRTW